MARNLCSFYHVTSIAARSTESVINTMCEVEGRPHDLLEYKHDCLFQLCRRCSNEEELFNEILKSEEEVFLEMLEEHNKGGKW